jgi:hypothetical protein
MNCHFVSSLIIYAIGRSYLKVVAALAVANEVKDIVGEAQALITIYKDCKMMLLPIPSYEILVGFVLPRSVNAEGYNIANKIERLLAKEC